MDLALLSFGLIVVIPIGYGSGQVFRLVEPFFSARPLAEALCFVALAALVSQRRIPAAVFAAMAISIHPLMALPVVLIMTIASLAPPQGWRNGVLLGLALIAASLVSALLLGGSEPLMSGQWLESTQLRSRYLFIDTWSTGDWQTQVLPLATLALVTAVLPAGKVTVLARAALIVGAAGLLLTVISGGPLPLKLLLQVQPWRWVWIGAFLALALLPMLVQSLWQSGRAGQASALLLIAAWMLAGWSSSDRIPPFGAGALIALIAFGLWAVRGKLSGRATRMVLAGGWFMVITITLAIAGSALAVARGGFQFGTDPRWIELTTEMFRVFPPLAAAAILAGWMLTTRCKSAMGSAAIAAVSIALLIAAAPGARASWTRGLLSAEEHAGFASWRKQIPPDAEVLWPDFPQGAWFLLERRNYLSDSQLAGIVFSEALAREARRRADALSGFTNPDEWFTRRCNPQGSCRSARPTDACRAADLDFVVLETGPGKSVARIEWPGPGFSLYLYDCAYLRGPAFR